ncbi:MAG: NAD(P)-dependent oxidoreductase [Candidatus Krumholzibacteriia bacterium]
MTAPPPLAVVTGATGFLGSHIADRLLLRGARVRASVRPTSDLRWLRDKPVETVVADLASAADTQRLLRGARWLVHCAGVVAARDEEGYRRGNVDTTRALLAAAAQTDGIEAVVLISSLAAAGPAPLAAPQVESAPCRPISAYGRSKVAAEALVNEVDWPFRTAVLRPPALYGPRDREFLLLFRAAALGWTARPGGSLSGLSLVHGADAAEAAVTLLATPTARGVYFVDDGGDDATGPVAAQRRHRWGHDPQELTAALAQVLRRRVRTVPLPVAPLRWASALLGERARRWPLLNPDRLTDLTAPGWVCSGERLLRETEFRPRFQLAGGLQDTLDFYRGARWMT